MCVCVCVCVVVVVKRQRTRNRQKRKIEHLCKGNVCVSLMCVCVSDVCVCVCGGGVNMSRPVYERDTRLSVGPLRDRKSVV